MDIPDETSEYLHAHYWNERFKHEDCYEWLGAYDSFKDELHRYLEKEAKESSESSLSDYSFDRILVIGNGNSYMGQSVSLDEKLCKHTSGCTITDIAPVVVDKSSEKARLSNSQLTSTSWAVCDMLRMPFKDHSVDLIIEKGKLWWHVWDSIA